MDIRATHSRAMDILATRDTPLTPVLRAMDTQATRDSPLTPPPQATDTQAPQEIPLTRARRGMRRQPIRDTPAIPILQATDTRAARRTLPTQVRIMDIPATVSPPIALRRTGLLEPSTGSSLLAELRPKVHPKSSTPLVRSEGETPP